MNNPFTALKHWWHCRNIPKVTHIKGSSDLVYVSCAGDVVLVLEGDTVVRLTNMPAYSIVPLKCKRIHEDTTAKVILMTKGS